MEGSGGVGGRERHQIERARESNQEGEIEMDRGSR